MKTISIKITDKQYEKLKELAKEIEVSMSEQIRRGIECYLDELLKKKCPQSEKEGGD